MTKNKSKIKFKSLSWSGFPDIYKRRLNKLDIDTPTKQLLRKCVVEKRKSGELKSRDLWYLDGFNKSLKLCLPKAKATKIINDSNKFKLSPLLTKRISKYSKSQQKEILRIIEQKISTGKLTKTQLWYDSNLSKIVNKVLKNNQ